MASEWPSRPSTLGGQNAPSVPSGLLEATSSRASAVQHSSAEAGGSDHEQPSATSTAPEPVPHHTVDQHKVTPCDPQAYKKVASLEWTDVFSFIVNKMIGSGIFTTPLLSLLMTRDRLATIMLWLGAFLHTMISTLIYIDYCAVFPYTGGELNYLSQMLSRFRDYPVPGQPTSDPPRWKIWGRRVLGDGLMPFVNYSILFVCLFSSTSNVMQFGRLVFLTNWTPGEMGPTSWTSRESNLVGVVTFTALCVLHLLIPAAGRMLNNVAALLKILLMLGLIIVAASSSTLGELDDRCLQSEELVSRQEMLSGSDAEDVVQVGSEDRSNPLLFSRALLSILFSFQGWENATFVAGETSNKRNMQKGFISAVTLVGLLYMGVVLAFVLRVNMDDLDKIADEININYAPMLTGCDQRSVQLWAVFAAASALGSMNSIIYTSARVKQAIGHAKVLPWSRFWSSVHVVEPRQETPDLTGPGNIVARWRHALPDIIQVAPKGGIALHWIMTIVVLIAIHWIPQERGSVGIPGLLQTYTHMLVLAILGALWYSLPSKEKALGPERQVTNHGEVVSNEGATTNKKKAKEFDILRLSRLIEMSGGLKIFFYILVFLYTIFNLVMLGFPLGTHLLGNLQVGDQDSHGWTLAAVTFGLVLSGFVYYALVFGAAETRYYDFRQRYDEDLDRRWREKWERRYADGRAFLSLKPPADQILGTDGQTPPSGLLGSFNLPALAGVNVVIQKEARHTKYTDVVERINQYGRLWTISFRPPRNQEHDFAPGYRNEGESPFWQDIPMETIPARVDRNETQGNEQPNTGSNSRGVGDDTNTGRNATDPTVEGEPEPEGDDKKWYLLYWLFGGVKWIDETPLQRLSKEYRRWRNRWS